MNDENELLEPLATEAGQEAIVRAIRDISSLEYAVRAEQAASTASAKAGEASQSALEASEAESKAKDWATKTDTYVEQQIITIPPAQEGEEPTTETINLYSAKYYAALAQDIYNNMSFDSVPTENSTNMVSSGTVYSALDLKADKSTTYTKTETDNLINTRLAELVASAPAALDTLQELATALGNDPNFATTIATQLGNKADKSDTYTKAEVDTALSNVQGQLTFDNVPTANSDNPVKSSGIKTALDGKQDTLTFDSTPTANSTNPVTSGGVYTALQNVNIDIDDEITEDSDNPVTSAAIWEALQNFTPSGEGGGVGNASGMITDILYESENGYNTDETDLSLNKSINDYDLLVFVANRKGASENKLGESVTIDSVKHFKTLTDLTTTGKTYMMNEYSNEYLRLAYKTDTIIRAIKFNTLALKYIYGIKFSKNLSEQMYSNVLYENSSGWSSGSITLNDSLENYDLIQVSVFYPNDANTKLDGRVFFAKQLLDGRYMEVMGYASRYFRATVDSPTQMTRYQSGDYVVREIIGIKLAKGGYSGIVSDARMTVKSGTWESSGSLGRDTQGDINIAFDSPMPDTNYTVLITPNKETGYWTGTSYYVLENNKRTDGFTLHYYQDGGSTSGSVGISWIAIRPNSYTREGMVEDVLFSNANGVNSGTINLSGNISDYDLIQIFRTANSGAELYSSLLSSSDLLQRNSNSLRYVETGDGSNYIEIYCPTDSSVVIRSISGEKITKITGIKFGRYVSGVAVDTTVTQNSNAVVTSGAVYDALQNYTPSGGGSSITVDSTVTQNGTNPVTGAGIYTAIQNAINSITNANGVSY